MFVGVLLAAALLALERSENAYSRLVRGLVSPSGTALREDRPLGRWRGRRHAADGGVRVAVRAPGLGAVPAVGGGARVGGLAFGALGVAHRRPGPRGQRRLADGVRADSCRSRSSRWSPGTRSRARFARSSTRSRSCSRSGPALQAASNAFSGHRPGHRLAARASGRADDGVRRAGAPHAATVRRLRTRSGGTSRRR